METHFLSFTFLQSHLLDHIYTHNIHRLEQTCSLIKLNIFIKLMVQSLIKNEDDLLAKAHQAKLCFCMVSNI